MSKVIKTTFEEEQRMKDEAFMNLTPTERLVQTCLIRERMRKPGINYSYKGMKVTLKKTGESL